MNDFDEEKWYDLYRTALLEPDRAAMTGRISDARGEITARLERLKEYRGLHGEERQAIEDAIGTLRMLEREEATLAAEDKRRVLEETLNKLRQIALR